MIRNCISPFDRMVLNPPRTVLISQLRDRHFWKNMDCPMLRPPLNVRGMTELNRDAFHKIVTIPKLKLSEQKSYKVLSVIKKHLLKMERIKPVRTLEFEGNKDEKGTYKELLLHPSAVTDWESLSKVVKDYGVEKEEFFLEDLQLTYENWRADEIIKSILPDDDEGLTSYSRIGHIVHINLRDHLQPYKRIIGDVLRDKVAGCRTVVNKVSVISNIYRNFPIEVICGEEDFHVQVKENGVTFEFDFSKVYWNPRLSTEHERIVKLLKPGDVLYDIFAGVGPFSVPAAKKRCTVLANDLNPDSYTWLTHNAKKNKCLGFMTTFNREGRDFIMNEMREDLVRRLNEVSPSYKIHITMNLPAMSTEFLDTFRNLISPKEVDFDRNDINYPLVHLYSFAKGNNTEEVALRLAEHNLGLQFGDNLQSITFVRNVAPNKDMYRVAFYLTREMLTTPKIRGFRPKRHSESVDEAPSPKIPCSS